MAAQTYVNPDKPADIGSWRGVATENGEAVIPLSLWEHEHSGVRIVAFQGLDAGPAVPVNATYTIPATMPGWQACIVSNYECRGGSCDPDFDVTCHKYGSSEQRNIQLATVAAQVGTTFAKLHTPSQPIHMLTGHSLGCGIALSLGHVLDIPVVCFGFAGSFSATWASGWPGLKAAIQGISKDKFVIQTYGDPFSDCLTPRYPDDSSRSWAAAACTYAGPSPGCSGRGIQFSSFPFSTCV
eukprot:10228-Prymnesium_polylepis.1